MEREKRINRPSVASFRRSLLREKLASCLIKNLQIQKVAEFAWHRIIGF